MSTKYTLRDLVQHGLVKSGDSLGFTFKRHDFEAKLLDGGIIGFCTFDGDPVFRDRSGFLSLTDWSDTCIQECLQEFVTRFSSWKRIRHLPTGTPMFMLRSQLWERKSACRAPHAVTEESLLNERRRVVYLTQKVEELEMKLHRGPTTQCQQAEDDNPFRLKL